MQFPLIVSEQIAILIRLAVAMLLGALIGLDREVADKPVGLRTHMLVAGAAALLVSLGALTIYALAGELGSQVIRSDSFRIFWLFQ